jgi:hypothetical protein
MSESEYSLKVNVPKEAPKEATNVPKAVNSTPTESQEPQSVTPDSPTGVEYFAIDYWPEIILNPKLDIYKIVDKVIFVEEFIQDRIIELGLKNDKENYTSIVKSMEEELGISSKYEPHVRLEKIYNLIRIMKDSSQTKKNKIIKSLLKKNN